jgi:tetratricopeptide (TPR) repeat protein
MKAFFSYSSHDEAIVNAVARQLGRPFVTIDKNAFRTGDDLLQSIESAVRNSAIFVYFASEAGFDSDWVKHELKEAKYHHSMNKLRKFIVVLLDDRLGESDFPEWMRRFVFLPSHAAGPIARKIRSAIDDMVGEEQSGFFVGRATEQANLQAALVPPDNSASVAIVTIRGLPGIGRRTLLKRVAQDSLDIERLLTIRIEAGDKTNSIAAKLADLVEPVITPDETLAMARRIQSMPSSDACSNFVQSVTKALEMHELVVLYDEGGILDNNGSPTVDIIELLQATARKPGLLVALVTNRRPRLQGIPALEDSAIVDVGPLYESEVRQLIALKARAKNINFTPGIASALVERAKGYPPAVTALVQRAEVYGPELAPTAASSGAEYRPRPLTRYLAGLKLSRAERKMLSILARNSPLPLEILSLFAQNSRETGDALTKLIDASLVMPQSGTAWYRISDPVIDYIDRGFPVCSAADYATVANALGRFLDTDRETGAYLELSRVFYRALVHAGKDLQPKAYALMADWLRLAADFYHQRNYQKAQELAFTAYRETPSAEALSWIIRSNVKLGKMSQALEDVDEMRSLGHVRDAYFLRGFLERNSGNYKEAIKYYERAKHAGWTGLALERDLAECYFEADEFERATEYIDAAQSRQPDNPYVLSLRIKIACRQFDEETARRLLPLLKQADRPNFGAHRRSLVELTFGNISAAYEYALEAVGSEDRPPAEALANLAYCQILVNQTSAAIDTIERLESLYGSRWSDALASLKARAAIAEGRYENALNFLNLAARDSVTKMKLERDALKGSLEHDYLAPEVRQEREHRLTELEHRLSTTEPDGDADEHYWDILDD